MKRVRYVPNLNARSLSSRRSNLIGVVNPQTEPGKEFMFSNPFYGELLSVNGSPEKPITGQWVIEELMLLVRCERDKKIIPFLEVYFLPCTLC